MAIFKHLDADFAFACHWGAFRLTDEPYHEPVERLGKALSAAGIDPQRFRVAGPGHEMELR